MEVVGLVAGADQCMRKLFAALATIVEQRRGVRRSRPRSKRRLTNELNLGIGVGRESVDRNDHRDAKQSHVLDLLLEVPYPKLALLASLRLVQATIVLLYILTVIIFNLDWPRVRKLC